MRGWQKIILILMILVTGCATTRNYEKALNALIGSNEEDLVLIFGQPNKSYNLPDGRTVIEYSRYRVVEKNVGEPYLSMLPENYIGTPDIYKKTLWCKTSFVLDQTGTITSWSHEGNDCKASPAK